ncbi:MAG TPA: NAD+ synthase [Solirubrobacterales bacterium]|nr:NAD+ synthase [Solirubrobacterales bacterium]
MAGPPESLRVALAQINPTVGDLGGNARLILAAIGDAREAGADLVVLPELCLPGYPAEDLYLKRHFTEANQRALEELAGEVTGIVALVGFAEPAPSSPRADDAPRSRPARNALAVIEDGAVAAVYRKHRLPNYGVFDEARYFEPGTEPAVWMVAGVPVGLTICEDVWEEGAPASLAVDAGATVIVNASASPYLRGKGSARELMLADRARRYGVPFAFCNMVGGQDELVFDGHSFVAGPGGEILARGCQFEPDMVIWETAENRPPSRLAEPLDDLEEVYAALRLGLADYVRKNGFEHVVIALSGGIDSALVVLVAVDALGPERVSCVIMPSPHSSAETQADARAIAANLDVEAIEIPIEPAMHAYAEMLPELAGVAAENIQARIRGNIVMALSNARGWLVLTTGNKSEMSVGYATLYGDMAGGFAVIKDVPKTLVYRLVERRNELAGRELVPGSVLERPPSAELRPGQTDQDSLPPYDLLDRVLEAYVEADRSRAEIVASGIPAEIVDEVIRMVDRAEYKRRQAPPGIRITPRAFGRDRRLPITNRFGG